MTRGRAGPASIRPDPRGFALLIVLWTMVLMALLVTHLTAAGHSEARIAANYSANAAAEADADGVVYESVFRVMDGDWSPDGTMHELKLAHGTAKVRLLTESGKINPNSASVELLAALMRALGAPPEQAATLADTIADWREPNDQPRPDGAKQPQYRAAGLDYGPPGAPFESLDELGRVLGMLRDLAAAMKPHLSLYTFGDPDPAYADPIVLQAMKQLPQNNPAQQALPAALTVGLETMSVVAEAHSDSGGIFTRRAILRIGPAFEHGYQLIEWEDGAVN